MRMIRKLANRLLGGKKRLKDLDMLSLEKIGLDVAALFKSLKKRHRKDEDLFSIVPEYKI